MWIQIALFRLHGEIFTPTCMAICLMNLSRARKFFLCILHVTTLPLCAVFQGKFQRDLNKICVYVEAQKQRIFIIRNNKTREWSSTSITWETLPIVGWNSLRDGGCCPQCTNELFFVLTT